MMSKGHGLERLSPSPVFFSAMCYSVEDGSSLSNLSLRDIAAVFPGSEPCIEWNIC